MGIACAAIGLYHLVLGIASVPGEGPTGATVDSRERFYNAIFFGYWLACIWVARQSPIPSTAVRWLAGIFLLGGIGRGLSVAVHGRTGSKCRSAPLNSAFPRSSSGCRPRTSGGRGRRPRAGTVSGRSDHGPSARPTHLPHSVSCCR
ncbi:DUF4345 domain-containing protein [Streptomyces sp. NPDC017964]